MNSDPIRQSLNLPNSSTNISADGVSQLIERANLSMAAGFARKRHYNQAEQMILPLINIEKPRFEALNLLAKIYAQQGQFQKAAAMWGHAHALEPENRQILLALEECERITAGSHGSRDLSNLRQIFVALNIIFIIAAAICITIVISIK